MMNGIQYTGSLRQAASRFLTLRKLGPGHLGGGAVLEASRFFEVLSFAGAGVRVPDVFDL
jgi:hypothetical protein